MNINKLKPIPKYIEKNTLALDKQIDPNRRGLRFYAYITTIDKDIAKVTVALRNKGKVVQMKQVCVHALNDERAYIKDIEYNYLGISAYRVALRRMRKAICARLFVRRKNYIVLYKLLIALVRHFLTLCVRRRSPILQVRLQLRSLQQ